LSNKGDLILPFIPYDFPQIFLCLHRPERNLKQAFYLFVSVLFRLFQKALKYRSPFNKLMRPCFPFLAFLLVEKFPSFILQLSDFFLCFSNLFADVSHLKIPFPLFLHKKKQPSSLRLLSLSICLFIIQNI